MGASLDNATEACDLAGARAYLDRLASVVDAGMGLRREDEGRLLRAIEAGEITPPGRGGPVPLDEGMGATARRLAGASRAITGAIPEGEHGR